jgi:hypothetical protein
VFAGRLGPIGLVVTIRAAPSPNHVSALYRCFIESVLDLYSPNLLMQIDKQRPSGILRTDRARRG